MKVALSRLSYDEFALTQSYLDHVQEQLLNLGLRLETHCDLDAWKALLESAPGVESLSKPLDPAVNYIQPNEAFWISLETVKGETIACVGARMVDTTDFIEEFVTTYLLFGDLKPRLQLEPYGFVENPPTIYGRVGYGGGSWVHPDWRNLDLSGVTSRLGRVIALRHLRVDYYTCFIKATTKRKSWSAETLGWPHSRPLTTGHHPGRDNYVADSLFLWAQKEEILDLCNERRPLRHRQQGRLQRTG